MYKSFKNYRQDRELIGFGQKYDQLCESIINSGNSFDQFWLEHGLPRLIDGTIATEDELLEAWYNPMSWGKKAEQPAEIPQQNFVPQEQPKPQLSADSQAKAASAMQAIKQAFVKSMTGIIQQYKQNRDSVGYQLAKGFLDKVSAYAEKLKIQKGEGRFDRDAEFGKSQNVGPDAGANIGDRWKQMASTPEGKERMAQQYSQKLGVSPDMIKKLIDQGFTNPSMWPGIINQHKQMQPERPQPTVGANIMQRKPQPVGG